MSRKRGFVIMLLTAVICIPMLLSSAFAADLQVAPQNPAFYDALNNRPVAATSIMGGMVIQQGVSTTDPSQGRTNGLIPSIHDLTHLQGQEIIPPSAHLMAAGIQIMNTPPGSFDLRTLGKVSPVKDQGTCGDCWAFATYGSMESALLPSSLFSFSENNLDNTSGFDSPGPCQGGNFDMSMAYLSRWSGPVLQSLDPDSNATVSPANLPAARHVQDVLIIPDRTNPLDNANIRTALQTYGAVSTSMYVFDGASYNGQTFAYCYTGRNGSNHAVTIVGWDDNFPASNFQTKPAGNGAFIVKNSWGTSFGNAGYFYVSYYDTNIGTSNAVFLNAEPLTNYNADYQYDPYGWINSIGFGNNQTAWFSNVFTAATNGNVAAVSFYTPQINASYSINVYTNVSGVPIHGTIAGTTSSGTIPYAGYHTVNLDTQVPVLQGQKFSVVVQLTTPGYTTPIAIQNAIPGYTSKATANPGQSFISPDGINWQDATTTFDSSTSVCLKAFTTPYNPPACTFSTTPATNGAFSAAGSASTVAVTAPAGCAWTVSNSLGWVSVTSGNSGSGNGTVAFAVAPNSTSSMRSGNITIAGQSYIVTQYGQTCQYSIFPLTSPLLPYTGGTGSVTVTAPSGCAWKVANNSPGWATITSGASGTGNGTVTYSIPANTLGVINGSSLLIGGQTHYIEQQAKPCTYTITSTGIPMIAAAGGTATFNIATQTSCPWQITNIPSWAIAPSVFSGSGNGSVSVKMPANTAYAARTGSIQMTVQNGQSYNYAVNQPGAPCTYSINSSASALIPYTGGSATVTATAAPIGCTWNTTDTLNWATVSAGGTGVGSGAVIINVAPNPTYQNRTGTISISGATYTINQAGIPCTYSINQSASSYLNYSGDSGIISVSAPAGCAWSTADSLGWTSITSGSGNGNGTVKYSVGANASSVARAGTITVAGKVYTINQAGAPCTYSINPTSNNTLPYATGTFNVAVTAPTGCPWTVSDSLSWVTSGSTGPSISGSGNGTATFNFTANPTVTPRTGNVTIAGQQFSVTQAGTPCTFSLSATSSPLLNANGTTGSISVTAPTGCGWQASDALPWATITSGGAGSGNGIVNYSVSANSTYVQRSGAITVAGKSYTVYQAGQPCTYSINPVASATLPYTATTGNFAVKAPIGCSWAVADSLNWATIKSGASGSGNGTVTYSVAATTTSLPRNGTMTVAGQTFTVNQAGSPCTYTVPSTQGSMISGVGLTSNFYLTTPTGCPWTLSGIPSFVKITSATSGSGSQLISYSASANTTNTTRSGSLTVVGSGNATPAIFTINQSGNPATCTYTINPSTAQTVSSARGTLQVNVSTQQNCTWTWNNSAWLSASSVSNGTNGQGYVTYAISPNTATALRVSTITIAGKSLTVTQNPVGK